MPGPAVDREHHELVDRQRGEHDERLLEGGLGADALVLAHHHVAQQRQRQRMLPKHRTLEHIERESGEEAERDAAAARRIDRPVEHREHQERGPQHVEPRRQRQHGENQRHQRARQHAAARVAGHERAPLAAGGAVSGAGAAAGGAAGLAAGAGGGAGGGGRRGGAGLAGPRAARWWTARWWTARCWTARWWTARWWTARRWVSAAPAALASRRCRA